MTKDRYIYTVQYELDANEEENEGRKRKGKNRTGKKQRSWLFMTFPFWVTIVSVAFAVFLDGWWYSWLFLLLIPVYYTTVLSVEKKKPSLFCYPLVLVIVYCTLGLFFNLWHPLWMIFLTVPIYYQTVRYFRKKREAEEE